MDFGVKKSLTVDDVVRSGACRDGVMKWLDNNNLMITSIPTYVALSLCKNDYERKHIEFASGVISYGNDCGNGNGNGNSNSYGNDFCNGNGNGYGDGNGYVDGNGYGDGCGYDDGNGNGYGYGCGYGDGYGYADGYGDGYKKHIVC